MQAPWPQRRSRLQHIILPRPAAVQYPASRMQRRLSQGSLRPCLKRRPSGQQMQRSPDMVLRITGSPWVVGGTYT